MLLRQSRVMFTAFLFFWGLSQTVSLRDLVCRLPINIFIGNRRFRLVLQAFLSVVYQSLDFPLLLVFLFFDAVAFAQLGMMTAYFTNQKLRLGLRFFLREVRPPLGFRASFSLVLFYIAWLSVIMP